MTDPDSTEAMRRAAREVLREIVPAMVREAAAGARPNGHGNGNGNGHGQAGPPAPIAGAGVQDETVLPVPAPPVAAVLRPSTWTGPAVPGEVIGEGAGVAVPGHVIGEGAGVAVPGHVIGEGVGVAAPDDPGAGEHPDVSVEPVTIDTDADLDRFVRALMARLESPRDRRAIRAGQIRFGLRRTAAARPGPDSMAESAPTIRVTKGAVTERTVRDAAAQGARLVLARGAVLTPLARDQARALGVEIDKEARC